MKASKIQIEIGHNNELKYVVFKNEDVFKAMKKLQKEYKDCIVYSIKTQY
jgi:hypothetical protein